MSKVARSRDELERLGECCIVSNTAFFAVFARTLEHRREAADRRGRTPNLILFRSEGGERDHWVMSLEIFKDAFVESSLANMRQGGRRWNCRIEDHLISVTNTRLRFDVRQFYGASLVTEVAEAGVIHSDFQTAVGNAAPLSDAELTARLAAAPAKPERVRVAATAFRRNPHVVVAVLRLAGGVCEQCRKPAPFARVSDGTPFLEVHHDVPLADGGDDTVANARALCPNCHRDAHHGPASVR